uniref:Complement component C9 n=1 Tax=Sphenodon punctatus TaxID=8508 RepID=A0A8D0GS55_SPHPU
RQAAFASSFEPNDEEAGAPSPVDCKLSSWNEWGPCDPCTNQRFRSRSVLQFGQFGGRQCLDPLGDTQTCKTGRVCPLEQETDCGSDFQCETGHCIKKRLVCNTDNDCGDYSDEDNCDPDQTRPPCRGRELDVSELGRTAGRGINILGMQPKETPFQNEFFNGLCDRVRDGNTGIYYLKPWNTAVLNYDTKADKRFATETYNSHMMMVTELFKEKLEYFKAEFTLKLRPTEDTSSQSLGLNASLGFESSKSSTLNSFFKSSNDKNRPLFSSLFLSGWLQNQVFIRVKGKIQLGTFQMRNRDVRLTDNFLDDLKFLPSDYDKGEYFKFLENYGTHYALSGILGGKFDLLYVLDSQKITETVKKCLGYNTDISLTVDNLDSQLGVKGGECNISSSGVIDDVISLIEGGKTNVAVKLKEMLSRDAKAVNVEDYVNWAGSLADAPVVIQQRPSPIYTLVPVKMKDAYIKKQNLERAIEDYLTEYSVCKCQPCQNVGTVMLVDGECICGCSSYFKGIAYYNIKKPFSFTEK